MKCKLLNTYKLKKHFKKGLTPLLCALTIFNICGINVSAASHISFGFQEPYVGENTGWIAVKISRNNIDYDYLIYYVWLPDSTYVNSSLQDGYMFSTSNYVQFTSDSQSVELNFQFGQPGYFVLYNMFDGETHDREDNYVYDLTRIDSNDMVPKNINFGYGSTITAICWKGALFGRNIVEYSGTNIDSYATFGQDTVLLDRINTFNTNLSTLINNTQSMINGINLTNTYLSGISQKITTTNNHLLNIDEVLDKIYGNTATIQDDVSIIKGALTSESNGSIQDVSSSGITSVENKENSLVGNNASTSELSVNINPLASSVVWNLVDTVVTSNAKVFTMFISILTIAVIGLILNR